MCTDLEEIKTLISLIRELRKKLSEVQKKNGAAASAHFEDLLRDYLKTKIELDVRGLLLPSIQISGLRKAEIISQILETNTVLVEHYQSLHKTLDVREAEFKYHELVSEVATSTTDLASMDADLISLNTSQKDQVHEKLNDLRGVINKAIWETQDHKQRVLDKINELQRELDREISSYTKNLGKLVELGDAIGEFGKRVKPATDRIKDITDCFKIFKKDNAQIAKQPDPLKIEDLREGSEE